MRPLSAAGILEAWERGQARRPFERGLAMLAVAHPDEAWDSLADLPIGNMDMRLLSLREVSLGGVLHAFVQCPVCGGELTFELRAEDLRGETPPPESGETYELRGGAMSSRFRLPTTLDFVDLPFSADVGAVRRHLARRCVLEVERDGLPLDLDALPSELIDEISEEMSRCDPQAHTVINMTCPACDHHWSGLFDIATFLWAEIASLASRLLGEVDVLARAYGWREADILGLSASRREAYLQLAL
jgi:hypothetical protein